MSRLHDLIEQAKLSNPNLGQKLEEEFSRLENRRNFGLVFERHEPEATELYGRPVRRGDKVHILPARGSSEKPDPRLWRVIQISRDQTPTAELLEILPGDEPWNADHIGRDQAAETVAVENLVVVAEHTDTIYPGLVETGRVDNADEEVPAHTVINAENYHALQALTYTHRHAVDCIYIDPPYNTGAKDWKYNNDYVEADDDYRHSKWLSFMEKRLLLAKELLNPDDSVLIVTIDEKEYLRLGMLLEQTFPEARIQMITNVINPMGSERKGAFSRVDEYIYVVMFGSMAVQPFGDDMLSKNNKGDDDFDTSPVNVRWTPVVRDGSNWQRSARPKSFFPVYVDSNKKIVGYGEFLPEGMDRHDYDLAPNDVYVVWPMKGQEEARWQISGDAMIRLQEEGFLRVSSLDIPSQKMNAYYVTEGTRNKFESGEVVETGLREDGSKILVYPTGQSRKPRSVWNRKSHSARDQGSSLIGEIIPSRHFPYPKSLYAVEDTLRFFVKNKPNATVLDFFSGSGTTAHAVMRLNRQDGGQRKSISVTNNEVSADEQKTLRRAGLRPGDPEWEALGICDYVTKPRITAVITGRTPEGEPIKGDYKFTDEFPMAEGFEANARFFTLTYEHPVSVEYGRAFSRIAPMLWIRAGQGGRIIDRLPECGWDVTDHYGVLGDVDQAGEFVDAVNARENITHVFIVTDNISAYQRIARGLSENIEAIRLYESYLTNFKINHGQVTL